MLSNEPYNNKLFGFSGRIKRWDFAKKYILVSVVFLLVSFAGDVWEEVEDVFVLSIFFVVYAGLFFASFGLAVRRLHDFDATGWYSLWSFVPLANIALVVFLFAQNSSPEDQPNRYGLPKNFVG